MFDRKEIIDIPTRVRTSSTIDLVMVSDQDKINQSGVVDFCISDHQMIYCKRKVTGCHQKVRIQLDLIKTIVKMNLMSCSLILIGKKYSRDVQEVWNIFKQKFMAVIAIIPPIKTIRVKQRSFTVCT